MALDIAILGPTGAPTEFVSVGVDEHWALLERAKPLERFPLLRRLSDYYEDATFAANEVATLRDELLRLDRRGLADLIDRLVAIAAHAEARCATLEALSD